MFGMNENHCKDAVFKNALKIIKHSEIRKNVNIGTISLQHYVKQSDQWLINEFNKRTSDEEDYNKSKRVKLDK